MGYQAGANIAGKEKNEMMFLNLGCGYPRIEGDDWVNLDDLHSHLSIGTPERNNLDKEVNYVNHDLLSGPLPFSDESFDGALLSHVLEHFSCQESLAIMRDCKRVLKRGGCLLASVPNASYFRQVFADDSVRNWPRLFGVTDPANPIPTFFEAALWMAEHRAILTEDALWCYFMRAGFEILDSPSFKMIEGGLQWHGHEWSFDAFLKMIPFLNRREFSLEMVGIKR